MTARDPGKASAEQAFIKACIARDPTAWREMITKYGSLVAHAARTTLFRVLKTVDPTHVEEASQAIWAMLLDDGCRRLKGFAGQSMLGTWLTVLATRRTLDFIRTEMRKGTLKYVKIDGEEEVDLMKILRDKEAPNDNLTNDDMEALYGSLDQLIAEERLILKLYYLDGLSYRSIGKTMKLAPNTVSSYIYRARESLKAIIQKKS